MAGKFITALAISLGAAVVWSCQDAPATDSGARPVTEPLSTPPENLPLKEIMRGLEGDMAELAHGLWIEDAAIVSAAATRIADHPRVIPDQMGIIQAALASEFPAFVALDRGVHDAAVALATAADSSLATPDLFDVYVRILEGCASCHATFRGRVADALGREESAR